VIERLPSDDRMNIVYDARCLRLTLEDLATHG
jgi:hypothetical protein